MPVPERDHHDVVDSPGPRPGGARPGRRSWRRSRSATRPAGQLGRRSGRSSRRPWAWGRLGAKRRRPWRSSMPGAPTPTAVHRRRRASATAASSSATTAATARRHGLGDVGCRTIVAWCRSGWRPGPRPRSRSDGPRATPSTLVPPMSIPKVDVGAGRRAAVRRHDDDSTRAFSSRRAVDMMRLVARILMKPGMGTRSSTSRW